MRVMEERYRLMGNNLSNRYQLLEAERSMYMLKLFIPFQVKLPLCMILGTHRSLVIFIDNWLGLGDFHWGKPPLGNCQHARGSSIFSSIPHYFLRYSLRRFRTTGYILSHTIKIIYWNLKLKNIRFCSHTRLQSLVILRKEWRRLVRRFKLVPNSQNIEWKKMRDSDFDLTQLLRWRLDQ